MLKLNLLHTAFEVCPVCSVWSVCLSIYQHIKSYLKSVQFVLYGLSVCLLPTYQDVSEVCPDCSVWSVCMVCLSVYYQHIKTYLKSVQFVQYGLSVWSVCLSITNISRRIWSLSRLFSMVCLYGLSITNTSRRTWSLSSLFCMVCLSVCLFTNTSRRTWSLSNLFCMVCLSVCLSTTNTSRRTWSLSSLFCMVCRSPDVSAHMVCLSVCLLPTHQDVPEVCPVCSVWSVCLSTTNTSRRTWSLSSLFCMVCRSPDVSAHMVCLSTTNSSRRTWSLSSLFCMVCLSVCLLPTHQDVPEVCPVCSVWSVCLSVCLLPTHQDVPEVCPVCSVWSVCLSVCLLPTHQDVPEVCPVCSVWSVCMVCLYGLSVCLSTTNSSRRTWSLSSLFCMVCLSVYYQHIKTYLKSVQFVLDGLAVTGRVSTHGLFVCLSVYYQHIKTYLKSVQFVLYGLSVCLLPTHQDLPEVCPVCSVWSGGRRTCRHTWSVCPSCGSSSRRLRAGRPGTAGGTPRAAQTCWSQPANREREMSYLTTHSTHFIYGYMASDIWLRTILIVRKKTRCHQIG